ncbi:EamA family transporter [Brevibacterium oceani]|uniref:EamA family transporter n=1 Tax=Brevibacterium oceani TaxID=358099 RepID=UPI0015E72280|nr:EamA family transporter [Brevibacterium oceani]
MSFKHCLLAASVAVMWGLNFLAIDVSLDQFPPFLLAAIRFALLALPALLFVPKPDVKFRWIIGYGFGFGLLQFLFLYWAMAAGMPAGLASLVLQASGPFTVLLGMTFLREKVRGSQMVFLLIAMAGLGVVGWQRLDAHASFIPFLLTLAGAFGWAIGNICNRQAHSTEPIKLTMWMSVVPPVPMFILSLLVEGPERVGESFLGLTSPTGLLAIAGLLYTVIIATILGSGIWSWLMARNPAGVVAPFSMLVPVVGMSAAFVFLGERVTVGELCGAVLVVLGVLGAGLKAAKGARILAEAVPADEAALPSSDSQEGAGGESGVGDETDVPAGTR